MNATIAYEHAEEVYDLPVLDHTEKDFAKYEALSLVRLTK